MLNIYLNTWGNYNENGADGGEWVTLPMEWKELQEVMDRIAESMGDSDPEWFINDYEWTADIDCAVSEHDNIEDLNELCETLDGMDSYEQTVIAAYMEGFSDNLWEAVEIVKSGDYQFYEDMDLTEAAEEIVRDCYICKDTPEIFERYFDYEAFGRDLSFDGYTETSYGVLYIC